MFCLLPSACRYGYTLCLHLNGSTDCIHFRQIRVHPPSVPREHEHSICKKIGASQVERKKQNGYFIENQRFSLISVTYGQQRLNKAA
jgi:hypothetical protein